MRTTALGTNNRRRRTIALAAVLAGGLLLGIAPLGPSLIVAEPARDPGAIVSLASQERERLPAVVALAHRYPVATILLTVPTVVTELNCHDCNERQSTLLRNGIAPRRIRLLTDAGRNTFDEARACLAYVTDAGTNELLIVTSPYHTRRALATFRKVFENSGVRLAIHPAMNHSPIRLHRWWLYEYDLEYVAYESAAILYYAARYAVWPWAV